MKDVYSQEFGRKCSLCKRQAFGSSHIVLKDGIISEITTNYSWAVVMGRRSRWELWGHKPSTPESNWNRQNQKCSKRQSFPLSLPLSLPFPFSLPLPLSPFPLPFSPFSLPPSIQVKPWETSTGSKKRSNPRNIFQPFFQKHLTRLLVWHVRQGHTHKCHPLSTPRHTQIYWASKQINSKDSSPPISKSSSFFGVPLIINPIGNH